MEAQNHQSREVKAPRVAKLQYNGNYWHLFLWTALFSLINLLASLTIIGAMFVMPLTIHYFARWVINNTTIVE